MSQHSAQVDEHRAAPSQLPPCSPAQERDQRAFRRYRIGREAIERRSITRGLILLAVAVLVFSIAHAGLDRVFVHGWWRP